ncbi:MAG: C40 family peptidase [Acidimicrobiales bacterium]
MSDVDFSSTPPSPRHRGRAGSGRTSALVVASTLCAIVVGALLVGVGAAGADPVSDTQNRVNQVNGQLQGAQARATQIAAQLQVDGARLDVLSQQYEAAQEQVQGLDAQLSAIQAQITQTQARVDAATTKLRGAALRSYMSGASGSAIASLFSSTGENALVLQEYRTVASNDIANDIDVLHQAERALSVEQGQLQATEAQARTAEAQSAAAQAQAQAVAANQQAALNQVKGQIAALVAQKQQAQQAAAAAAFAARQAAAAAAAAQHFGGGVSNVAVSPGAGGAVQAAESQLGVPYRWGGESPKGSADPGFDCSGLTQWSWRQAGVGLPRTAQEQYDAIPHVSMGSLQPGDLVFWDDGTSSVQHVGMYVGNGDVINAPSTGDVVKIEPIWSNGLVGAGRP